jgi:hypothetical protein
LSTRLLFRPLWWLSNVLLAVALVATIWSGAWELSVRQYLKGFSDAILPGVATPQEKIETILDWMRNGPPGLETEHPEKLSPHDPLDTLNYQQLLEVCGSATNAFMNLSSSAGLEVRRLLLLTPEHTAKHVVAEVNVDGRWVIVDATYRTLMKDAQGNLLTREQLQDPQVLLEATRSLPNYRPEYTYERFAHVRTWALPFPAVQVRKLLDKLFPTWDENVGWSLLLERRSFLYFFVSVSSLIFLVLVRVILAWLADHRLRIARFHLRANLGRAAVTFLRTPEIK